MNIKKELLECLVRTCVREVLNQTGKQLDPTKSKDANVPELEKTPIDNEPKEPSSNNNDPSAPEAISPPVMSKGVLFLNPSDTTKPISLGSVIKNDNNLKMNVVNYVKKSTGLDVKIDDKVLVSLRTMLQNPNVPNYLYIGKSTVDPQSGDLFLYVDRNINIAKDNSIPPSKTGVENEPTPSIQPIQQSAPPTTSSDVNAVNAVNEEFKKIVKKLVREVLYKK